MTHSNRPGPSPTPYLLSFSTRQLSETRPTRRLFRSLGGPVGWPPGLSAAVHFTRDAAPVPRASQERGLRVRATSGLGMVDRGAKAQRFLLCTLGVATCHLTMVPHPHTHPESSWVQPPGSED